LAKGRAAALFWTEFASYSVYVALGWLGLKLFGLPGTGMAFLGLYAFHWGVMYLVVRRMSGFALSKTNVRLSLLGITTVAITLCTRLALSEPWATTIGCFLALATGLYTMRTLIRLVGWDKIERSMRKIGLSFLARKLGSIKDAIGPQQKK
jgi:antigen flippase